MSSLDYYPISFFFVVVQVYITHHLIIIQFISFFVVIQVYIRLGGLYVPCEEDLSFHWRGLLHIQPPYFFLPTPIFFLRPANFFLNPKKNYNFNNFKIVCFKIFHLSVSHKKEEKTNNTLIFRAKILI